MTILRQGNLHNTQLNLAHSSIMITALSYMADGPNSFALDSTERFLFLSLLFIFIRG
jgi:hypothetical protein